MLAEGPDADRLTVLADHLESASFGLSGPSAAALREQAAGLARLLRGLVARAAAMDAPLLVVVAGGTGAGKSTTVNSLAGRRVAATGVVRPTTRAPLLICRPEDLARFTEGSLLQDLPRVTDADDASGSGRRLVVRTAPQLPQGLALLDTPDIDSVETANHRLAEQALDVADVWVWATTSRTYADEAGMAYLRLAARRQVLTAVVVTQLSDAVRQEVLADLDRLLRDHATDPDVRLTVPFADVTDDRVGPEAVAELQRWLEDLGGREQRASIRRRALSGMLSALPEELAPIRTAVTAEQEAAERLRSALGRAYGPVHEQLEAELDTGIPLRADVLDRWRRMVGAADALARMQTAAQRVRDLIRASTGAGGPPGTPRQVKAEVAETLSDTIVRILEQAAWDARRRFEADPVGRDLLERQSGLRDTDPDRPERVRTAVEAWSEEVADLVATVGADRTVRARRWSTALNAVATTAILVVFTVSGGLTGGEVGIAALASAASQALLVRLFGEQNLRRLLTEARQRLGSAMAGLVVTDRRAHDLAIEGARPDAGLVALLDEAVDGREP